MSNSRSGDETNGLTQAAAARPVHSTMWPAAGAYGHGGAAPPRIRGTGQAPKRRARNKLPEWKKERPAPCASGGELQTHACAAVHRGVCTMIERKGGQRHSMPGQPILQGTSPPCVPAKLLRRVQAGIGEDHVAHRAGRGQGRAGGPVMAPPRRARVAVCASQGCAQSSQGCAQSLDLTGKILA